MAQAPEITPLSTADIEQQAVDWLVTQFKQAENLQQFIHALNSIHADFEQTLEDIRTNLNVDVATGFMLDLLGSWVGEARQSRTDAVYRLFIKARILVNFSNGEANDLIQIVQVLKTATEAWNALTAEQQAAVDFQVYFSNYYPAYYNITITGLELTANDIAALVEILQEADPAGVGMDITNGVDLFRFDGTAEESFGEGILAEVYA